VTMLAGYRLGHSELHEAAEVQLSPSSRCGALPLIIMYV